MRGIFLWFTSSSWSKGYVPGDVREIKRAVGLPLTFDADEFPASERVDETVAGDITDVW